MARRQQLRTLSLEELVDLRYELTELILKGVSAQRARLEATLVALGDGTVSSGGGKRRGRPPGSGSKLKGRKVPPKYRNPKNRAETWAGRGATPRWLAAEIKKGKKREDFAIDKSAAKAKGRRAKKTGRKQKLTESAEASAAA